LFRAVELATDHATRFIGTVQHGVGWSPPFSRQYQTIRLQLQTRDFWVYT